jgi:general secretion pathway protein H
MERTETSSTGERHSTGGFTLMELLVVLTILGLALVLAMPTLGRLLPGLEMRAEARDVANVLREARARAIGRNEEVTVVIDLERGILEVGGKTALQLSQRISVPISTGDSTSLALARTEIRFFPDGTSTGGHLTLAQGERENHVAVDWLTGAVSLTE